MDDTTILGGTLNQLGQVAKQSVKQVVKIPEEMAQDAGGQVGILRKDDDQVKDDKSQSQWQSNEERIRFLKDLYGKSDMSQDGTQSKKSSEFQEQIVDKSSEEQKKLIELRQQLHRDYYDKLTNPPKQQEERPAEKVEQEKKQELAELEQKDAKKPPPLAVVREQNKAEMFRGAAG